jgi:hypothetical protein
MVLLAVLAVFWFVAFMMSKLFTRYGSPVGGVSAASVPAPEPTTTPAVAVDVPVPTWSELDDRQLTRLLKSAAP